MTWLKHLRRLTDCVSDGKLAVEATIGSSALPTGAATEQGLDDILAKLPADPATQTTLAAVLAKIIAAPATESKQDTIKTAVDAVTAKLSSDPATQTTLALIKTAVEGPTPAGTYRGKDRTTTTGAAEELTIPASSKRCIISCGPSSQAYIEINDNASTSSPLYFEDPFGPILLDLGSVTKLSAYVVAGNVGAVFFG